MRFGERTIGVVFATWVGCVLAGAIFYGPPEGSVKDWFPFVYLAGGAEMLFQAFLSGMPLFSLCLSASFLGTYCILMYGRDPVLAAATLAAGSAGALIGLFIRWLFHRLRPRSPRS